MLDGERLGQFASFEEFLALLFAVVAMAVLSPMWLAWPMRRGRTRPALVEAAPVTGPFARR